MSTGNIKAGPCSISLTKVHPERYYLFSPRLIRGCPWQLVRQQPLCSESKHSVCSLSKWVGPRPPCACPSGWAWVAGGQAGWAHQLSAALPLKSKVAGHVTKADWWGGSGSGSGSLGKSPGSRDSAVTQSACRTVPLHSVCSLHFLYFEL